jgi:hypothetical protein
MVSAFEQTAEALAHHVAVIDNKYVSRCSHRCYQANGR